MCSNSIEPKNSDYYPFGMLLPNTNVDPTDGSVLAENNGYRYGFNGKEKDDEVSGQGNSYDFGARLYNPRVGRWSSTDPKEKKQPNWSPYKAFLDNPIYWIDPSGETEWRSTDGKLIYSDGNDDGISYQLNDCYNESFDYSNIKPGGLNVKSESYVNLLNHSSSSELGDQIIEDYNETDNKQPGGDCSVVSSNRLTKAYKKVYGETLSQSLDNQGKTFEDYDLITQNRPHRLKIDGEIDNDFKGNGLAGGIKYAGLGTVVDENAIWSGVLKPGDPLQLWKKEDDYQAFQEAPDGEKANLSSYGHSAIFLGYVYEDGEITGMNIYDQGTGWGFPSNKEYLGKGTTSFSVIVGGSLESEDNNNSNETESDQQ